MYFKKNLDRKRLSCLHYPVAMGMTTQLLHFNFNTKLKENSVYLVMLALFRFCISKVLYFKTKIGIYFLQIDGRAHVCVSLNKLDLCTNEIVIEATVTDLNSDTTVQCKQGNVSVIIPYTYNKLEIEEERSFTPCHYTTVKVHRHVLNTNFIIDYHSWTLPLGVCVNFDRNAKVCKCYSDGVYV